MCAAVMSEQQIWDSINYLTYCTFIHQCIMFTYRCWWCGGLRYSKSRGPTSKTTYLSFSETCSWVNAPCADAPGALFKSSKAHGLVQVYLGRYHLHFTSQSARNLGTSVAQVVKELYSVPHSTHQCVTSSVHVYCEAAYVASNHLNN